MTRPPSPVPVDIPSDSDDNAVVAFSPSPPVLSKRSRGALVTTNSSDSIDVFSPTPPLSKRRQPAALPGPTPIFLLDDSPTPTKRLPAPAATPSIVAMVAETPCSIVPCSLGSPAAVGTETPHSIVAETPCSVVPCSLGARAVAGSSSSSSRKIPGVSSLISLESDDELEEARYRGPVKKLLNNTAKSEPAILSGTSSCSDKVDKGGQSTFSGSKINGTTNFEQPLHADWSSEDSSLQDESDSEAEIIGRETNSSSKRKRNSAQTAARKRQQKEETARLIEERKQKRQEDKRLQTEENARPIEESKQKQQEEKRLQEEDNARLIEERKQKQQEEKRLQKEENARLIEERKQKQQEDKRLKKEEKARLIEERKQKCQEDKLQKEAMKAQLAEMKKLEKERKKWETGKLALKSIVVEIDSKVIESGSVGGHLLNRFAEKGLSFRITSNPIEGSILWRMNVPDQIAQHPSSGLEVPYILFVHQAEEFCNLVSGTSFLDHVHRVQNQYPSFTICYVTNKLTSHMKKCEQSQYKNPSNSNSWRRPPVEEVLCKLTTHYTKVHSRQCTDEAEVAEHVVGLTSSLANCQFRKKFTWLSAHANGSIIPKDFIDKDLIKKNTWLKALIAIPRVQPRHALAIWKKYPTMRSLLNVYMHPAKTVHEKEFLLKDLRMEGPLGNEDRRLGEVCSKRLYRILMAQNGGVKTDDVENGADFFGV